MAFQNLTAVANKVQDLFVAEGLTRPSDSELTGDPLSPDQQAVQAEAFSNALSLPKSIVIRNIIRFFEAKANGNVKFRPDETGAFLNHVVIYVCYKLIFSTVTRIFKDTLAPPKPILERDLVGQPPAAFNGLSADHFAQLIAALQSEYQQQGLSIERDEYEAVKNDVVGLLCRKLYPNSLKEFADARGVPVPGVSDTASIGTNESRAAQPTSTDDLTDSSPLLPEPSPVAELAASGTMARTTSFVNSTESILPNEETISVSESTSSATTPSNTFLTSLAKRFLDAGWDWKELIATWKMRYESLMISFIDGGCGLCASWIGPDGNGIVVLTKTIEPPTPANNGWMLWAEGTLVAGNQLTIKYGLAFHSAQNAIRIQPLATAAWKNMTHCTIVIRKADLTKAEVTNGPPSANEQALELTRRT